MVLRLTTPRIELRPLPVQAAAALSGDRRKAARLLRAELHAAWPAPEFLDVLSRRASASPDADHFGVWVMIERSSATVVGDIGFHGPPDEAGTVELGYSVVPGRRRRGYATEAAAAIVEWASSCASVRAIVASCDRANTPSIRILERIGFRRIGEANGQLRWHRTGDVTTAE